MKMCIITNMKRKLILNFILLSSLTIFLSGTQAHAADLHWSPLSEPIGDGIYFSSANNWDLKRTPQSGDSLILPRNNWTAFQTFANDTESVYFNNIRIEGDYQWGPYIEGDPIFITGEIIASSDYVGYSTPSHFEHQINPLSTFRIRTYDTASIQFSGHINALNNNIGLYSYGSGIVMISDQVTGTGTLFVNGVSDTLSRLGLNNNALIQQAIVVRSGASIFGYGGTGNLTVDAAGKVQPDICITSKSLKIRGTYLPKISGSVSCSTNSRINAKGIVDVSGGTLTVNGAINASYKPKVGTQIILVSNDGNDPIKGYFKNKPHGSTFKLIEGYVFKISYKGGSGNDVVITRVK